MSPKRKTSEHKARLETLAEFRHQLRLFLQFSESAAQENNLQPQQHQLLLQIAGAPADTEPTIGYVANRLCLRHNTVVELTNRCEEAGLLVRTQGDNDRRNILLKLTPKGLSLLDLLAEDHARELDEMAPRLIRTLTLLAEVQGKLDKQGDRSR